MPRAVVCVGVPVDLEEQTFTLKNGDHAGEERTELSFHLLNPLTQVGGSMLFSTKSTHVMDSIKDANANGVSVQVVASADPIRSDKEDQYGRPKDWVKMRALAVS